MVDGYFKVTLYCVYTIQTLYINIEKKKKNVEFSNTKLNFQQELLYFFTVSRTSFFLKKEKNNLEKIIDKNTQEILICKKGRQINQPWFYRLTLVKNEKLGDVNSTLEGVPWW